MQSLVERKCRSRVVLVGLGVCCCASGPLADVAFGQVIPTFTNATSTRLVAAAATGASDTSEKDYGVGDLDQDGDLDVVVARRIRINAPSGEGAAAALPDTLLMNEGGVLTERTSTLAPALLVSAASRDVLVRDLNGDGLLDVLVGQGPSNLPLLLLNQGFTGSTWNGLAQAPAGLIPDGFLLDCWTLSAGDLRNDRDIYPDVFFGVKNGDDRMLTNTGALVGIWQGFQDDSAKLGASASTAGAVRSSQIADINLDGDDDIIQDVTNPTGAVRVVSNNGSGDFSAAPQVITSGAAYNFGLPDLNNDGRLDFVAVKNATDQYLLNTGNGAGDAITLSAAVNIPNTNGFGSIVTVGDLNYDGLDDVLICDLDQEFPADCSRRLKIYFTKASAPLLVEGYPVQQPWTPNGTSDAALIDLDNDGDLDMLIGHCTGNSIFMQDGSPPQPCPADLNGSGDIGQPDLGILLSGYGCTAGVGNCPGNIDGDDDTDQADLGLLLSVYGSDCP
jgi:hypothetical protein